MLLNANLAAGCLVADDLDDDNRSSPFIDRKINLSDVANIDSLLIDVSVGPFGLHIQLLSISSGNLQDVNRLDDDSSTGDSLDGESFDCD